ncbi:hypothetical protein SAMN05216224_10695 [Thioclava dalianensis]|nr:hypothetical protein SAMN05216224_10695 [Thioclava dalianensis]
MGYGAKIYNSAGGIVADTSYPVMSVFGVSQSVVAGVDTYTGSDGSITLYRHTHSVSSFNPSRGDLLLPRIGISEGLFPNVLGQDYILLTRGSPTDLVHVVPTYVPSPDGFGMALYDETGRVTFVSNGDTLDIKGFANAAITSANAQNNGVIATINTTSANADCAFISPALYGRNIDAGSHYIHVAPKIVRTTSTQWRVSTVAFDFPAQITNIITSNAFSCAIVAEVS